MHLGEQEQRREPQTRQEGENQKLQSRLGRHGTGREVKRTGWKQGVEEYCGMTQTGTNLGNCLEENVVLFSFCFQDYPFSSFSHMYLNQILAQQASPMCIVLLCYQWLPQWLSLLRYCSPFPVFRHVNLMPRANLCICPTSRRWCVSRGKWRKASVCGTWKPFPVPLMDDHWRVKNQRGLTVTYWIMWLWHLSSLLHLFYRGLWGREVLISGLWCAQKVKLLVLLFLCFDSLTPPLGSIFMCRAQLSEHLLCVFMVCFFNGHKPPLLLPSLWVVWKADSCWLVLLENLYLLKAVWNIW